ncbi:MAG: glycoside hydrolase family 88 protein [Acidobacteriota bacterium]
MVPLLFALAASCQIGLTSSDKPIPCLRETVANKPSVVVIGGLDGDDGNSALIRKGIAATKGRYSLFAIPVANPEKTALQFPPTGDAYAKNTESHYIWRWLGAHAPDLVIIVGSDPAHLAEALANNKAAGVGTIPARVVAANAGFLKGLDVKSSPAHEEISRRLARSPREVAQQLAVPYGHDLNQVVYINAVAVMGRLRLGETADVERLAEPYFTGQKNSLEKPTSSHFSGHLIFAELAERTKKPRYVELVRAAADMAFDADGKPKDAMPLNDEMSDSVFMGTPILAAAGKLTGDQKYFEMAVRHFRYMQKLDLRPDGLYRHSPLSEAAWGRGNAFPALGLALTLEYLPGNNVEVLTAYRNLMETLARFQDAEGMWHEVIDVPGSYAELTATSMIAVAMQKGIRQGWIPAAKYKPIVAHAWTAVKGRVAPDGKLIDVCTGTGKQQSLKAYLDRTAILGTDPRGGAMALLLATELMQ